MTCMNFGGGVSLSKVEAQGFGVFPWERAPSPPDTGNKGTAKALQWDASGGQFKTERSSENHSFQQLLGLQGSAYLRADYQNKRPRKCHIRKETPNQESQECQAVHKFRERKWQEDGGFSFIHCSGKRQVTVSTFYGRNNDIDKPSYLNHPDKHMAELALVAQA